MERRFVTVDGNEAVAHVAYHTNEVVAIYPITPASPMGEHADAWAARGRPNGFGAVPKVVEMQSEAGAAGALHGALQAGALATTFTASQGLLLMIPNLFKIAGELTPATLHVASRTVATHALSIFGDHSDVMAARSCGWAMLCSSTVQETQDMALVAQAATLASRVPFLHFFDGFRTSHEIGKIERIEPEEMIAFLPEEAIRAHRERALDPEHPVLRGSAQNPDVFFQAREAANPFYDATPGIVRETFERFAERFGRRYDLFEYHGHPEAERVLVLMGSGVGAVREAVDHLLSQGERVGLVQVRLYRPFDVEAFARVLPESVQRIAVLDRTKEPGATGEPLLQDVVVALTDAERYRARPADRPLVIGGRYGLSSKEFTPGMVLGVFAELARDEPRRRFTVGIRDDVTHLSVDWDATIDLEPDDVVRAVFFGLGSDGTVGANKNSVKIIGEGTDLYAQGYFVYDSRKAGAVTVSHLRFSPRPIESSYLVSRAGFVACHQFRLLERMDVLGLADRGATFLLNSPYPAREVWERLPEEVQREILEKDLEFWVIDGDRIAREVGLGGRINTVMQTAFFVLSKILPREEALQRIRAAIEKTYGARGESVLRKNFAAVDAALDALERVEIPGEIRGGRRRVPPVPEVAPEFVQRVTARMLEGQGDLLPVSALPVDGTFPTGTTRYEKRSIAREIPIWDPDICIECGLCPLVCPHAAIRSKAVPEETLAGAPGALPSRPFGDKSLPGHRLVIQVAPDDCTGCGVCADVCPARSKEVAKHKALDMLPKEPHLERERERWDAFLALPDPPRERVDAGTVKGSQLLEPLFEFSGACAGCGETPYIKLATQLFGDRMLIANATGCSSIYGGNLPTTPYTVNAQGRGPAWSNSLFEDNAEFGFGMRLAVDQERAYARALLERLSPGLDADLVRRVLDNPQREESQIEGVREALEALRPAIERLDHPDAPRLLALLPSLVRKSVWIVGGDGWAYDIGFGGLDHVIASGADVNLLVLDTGVYSNTGGQASKATPRAAVAKFAASGKTSRRKDLGAIAMAYGNVYVAQIALGANPKQTIRALREAESWHGPSLVIAYSHCIAHGIEMSGAMTHQKDVVGTGFWPLFRYDPRESGEHGHPFQLDSKRPKLPFRALAEQEARFAMLQRTHPEVAERLFELVQRDIEEQWHYYEQLAGIERSLPEEESADVAEVQS